MAPSSINDYLPVKHTSHTIPQLGFGVWASPRDKTTASVSNALKVGYRHIDTAQGYKNETEVGDAIAKSGIPRGDIFITTKFTANGLSEEEAYQSALESVKKCDPREDGYVDLFLIHTPAVGKERRPMLWGVLEKLQNEGRIRTIGVSNYGPKHLDEMKGYAKVWPPAVNQIELHPWTQQKDVAKYCEDNGILLEAYSPIVRNKKANDPILAPMAKKLGVATTQVLIRYCLQKGWVPLPKSDDEGRIRANADVYGFKLSDEQMKTLDSLDQGEAGACCPENTPGNID